jgi:hypothetical protein
MLNKKKNGNIRRVFNIELISLQLIFGTKAIGRKRLFSPRRARKNTNVGKLATKWLTHGNKVPVNNHGGAIFEQLILMCFPNNFVVFVVSPSLTFFRHRDF